MALPSLLKTWCISPNNVIVPGATAVDTCKAALLRIKKALIGDPSLTWLSSAPSSAFVVVGSSNGITAGMDGVDRWNSVSDVVAASGPNPHSWVVLRSTSIATKFEVLIKCNDTSAVYGNPAAILISENAGFTGGSTTAGPTALDQQNAKTSYWLNYGNYQRTYHFWISSDGQCVRFAEMMNGYVTSFYSFEKCNADADVVASGWSHPWLVKGASIGSSSLPSANIIQYNEMYQTGGIVRAGGVAATFKYTGEGMNNLSAALNNLGDSPNVFTGAYHLYPMGVASTDAAFRGRQGTVFDMWWKPLGMTSGDTFPANLSTKQFVVMGDIVLPWTGTPPPS